MPIEQIARAITPGKGPRPRAATKRRITTRSGRALSTIIKPLAASRIALGARLMAAQSPRKKETMAPKSVPKKAICTVSNAGPTISGKTFQSGGNIYPIISAPRGRPFTKAAGSTSVTIIPPRKSSVRTPPARRYFLFCFSSFLKKASPPSRSSRTRLPKPRCIVPHQQHRQWPSPPGATHCHKSSPNHLQRDGDCRRKLYAAL